MKEIWKSICGFEGLYEVSSFGRVKSLGNSFKRKEKFLKSCSNRGYLGVRLFKKGIKSRVLIHRLVAETFINNPKNKPFVNHRDLKKYNNAVSNLEWVTHRENMKHYYDATIGKLKKEIKQLKKELGKIKKESSKF